MLGVVFLTLPFSAETPPPRGSTHGLYAVWRFDTPDRWAPRRSGRTASASRYEKGRRLGPGWFAAPDSSRLQSLGPGWWEAFWGWRRRGRRDIPGNPSAPRTCASKLCKRCGRTAGGREGSRCRSTEDREGRLRRAWSPSDLSCRNSSCLSLTQKIPANWNYWSNNCNCADLIILLTFASAFIRSKRQFYSFPATNTKIRE